MLGDLLNTEPHADAFLPQDVPYHRERWRVPGLEIVLIEIITIQGKELIQYVQCVFLVLAFLHGFDLPK